MLCGHGSSGSFCPRHLMCLITLNRWHTLPVARPELRLVDLDLLSESVILRHRRVLCLLSSPTSTYLLDLRLVTNSLLRLKCDFKRRGLFILDMHVSYHKVDHRRDHFQQQMCVMFSFWVFSLPLVYVLAACKMWNSKMYELQGVWSPYLRLEPTIQKVGLFKSTYTKHFNYLCHITWNFEGW